jgi:oligoribonuclease NrnB/cAMP/cGMP phosphodiesterase (DHH superfamily)
MSNRPAKKRPTVPKASRRADRKPAAKSIGLPPAIVVSHGPFCLDGVAAAACVGRFYGESRVTPVFTHPSDVDRVIAEVARASKEPRDLWIADITWKYPTTETLFKDLVRQGWRIFWIDHHTIALEKNDRELRALGLTGWVASNRFSAARLLYEYLISAETLLGKAPSSLKRFEKVVLLADDNDRWVHKLRGSRELALTVAALGGTVAYRELLHLNAEARYSIRMEEAHRTASRELSDSIALATRTRLEKTAEDGLKIVAALCKGYTSEVAEALRQALTKNSGNAPRAIFLLYNLEDQRISLRRTPSCETDLSRLAGRFGGGGHPAASGFELPEAQGYLQNYLADRLQQALKE